MNNDDKYYIPEKFEDELLHSIATMAKEALKKNDILENIIRNYSEKYHKTSEDKLSSMTLQITNENYKPIFSTIKRSGEIKSPCFSRVKSKKDAKVPCIKNYQPQSPRKTNRINSSTERKRLSFDIEKDECEKLEEFTGNSDEFEKLEDNTDDSDACQMMITSPDKTRTPDRVNSVESVSESLDINQSLFYNEEEANVKDSPAEMISEAEISELVTDSTNHNAPNRSPGAPDELETMLDTPENENGIPMDCIDETTGNLWYLKLRSSFFTFEKIPSISDSPDKYIQERFSFDGKPETVTGPTIYDIYTEYPQTETCDTNEMKVSPGSENSLLVKCTIDDLKSPQNITINSFFSLGEETEVLGKPNASEKPHSFLDKKPETISNQSVDPLERLRASYKTPDKCQPEFVDAGKKEKTPVNQVVKRVTVKTSDDQESSASIKDIKMTNNPKINKRKSVDYSEEATISNLAIEDQEFKVPHKMYKIDDEEDKNIKDHDSISPTDESSKDENSFHPAYNSAYDYAYDSLKCPDNNFIDKQDIAKPADKSMSVLSANNNQPKVMSASPGESSESPAFQDSVTRSTLYSSPDDCQNKTAVRFKSNTINSKDVEIKTSSVDALESNAVERLTYLMRNLSPVVKHTPDRIQESLNGAAEIQKAHLQDKLSETVTPSKIYFTKRSLDRSFQKCLANRSDANGENQEEQLRLRDNQANIITPPRKCITPKVPDSKPNNIYAIQAEKFGETLRERRFRLCTDLKLFMDDRNNLRFICDYIYNLITVVKNIPTDAYNVEAVTDFIMEAWRLNKKAYSWISKIDEDLDVWEGVVQKIKQISQDIRCFCKEKKRDATPEDLKKWKDTLMIVSKKAYDMILLREVKKPSMLQFGTELENLIQLFLERLLEFGIVIRSPNVPSA